VQWLYDNGSIYAAAKTIDIATALNLQPCFTPVVREDLQVRLRPGQSDPGCPDPLTAVAHWMNDYNEVYPYRLALRFPREYIRAQSQHAACPV
jgi:hypothetical protein